MRVHHSSRFKGVIILLIILLICLINPVVAWSAEISKVKGSQVLVVDYSGQVGQEFFAVDGNGKRKAIITITKAKNGRGIGEITKGKAAVGYTLQERGGKRSSPGGQGSRMHIGLMFGYSMDNMSVPVLSKTETLTGSGFSVKGAGDIGFSESIGVRLMGGYESFDVKNATFTTKINYFTLDAIGRFVFNPASTFAIWLGAGMGFAIPFSKSTNILQEDSISTSTLLYVAGGFDWKLGNSWFIPMQADYSMFLPASDVKTSIIGIRSGIMWSF